MDFMLSRATRVTAQWASAPVQHAVARFWRDMEMTLSTTGFVPDNSLMICLAPALPPESYTLDVTENQLTLCAADDLGAVYGLLDISRHYLGVAPFWFWNQQQFEPKPFATVPEGRITGPAAAVGLRGWDLSDAPWLSAWADATENGWEMIFESLLRYRGNMVRTDKQADLAAAMGLRPVQNPQTPLGAAPQQAAAENPEERHKIWQDSIRTLKTSPRIWALGIDGMGGDPDGTAGTAALQEQWQLLNATVPGAAAYILLQGETVALYQEGKLKIPDSVIPVLTPAPSASSAGGPGPGAQHGLWFSLCRRDKLTGNPMTAYPGGDTAVNGMLQGAWRGGVRSFWMVGTGDLRPSLMELNLTGALWCTPDTDCAAQRTAYLRHTHAQHRHKGNIQHNIGQAGDQQQQQGGPAVPQPAQNTGVHVIAKVTQGAQRRDPQVEHRIIKGICRDLHQPQQRRAYKHCQYRDRDGAQIQKPYRRAHQHAQPIRIAAAHFLRNKDGRPVADAQKHAQQNFHWLCGGAHRRQRGGITEIAHHKGIHRAVKLLQDIAHTDRQGKQCRRFDDGAADHINFACMAGHAANHVPFTFPDVFIKLSLFLFVPTIISSWPWAVYLQN